MADGYDRKAPYALWIESDGTIVPVFDPLLPELKKAIGRDTVVTVPTNEQVVVYVDASSVVEGLPVNALATLTWQRLRAAAVEAEYELLGPVTFAGPDDDNGEPTRLPRWVLDVVSPVTSPSWWPR